MHGLPKLHVPERNRIFLFIDLLQLNQNFVVRNTLFDFHDCIIVHKIQRYQVSSKSLVPDGAWG